MRTSREASKCTSGSREKEERKKSRKEPAKPVMLLLIICRGDPALLWGSEKVDHIFMRSPCQGEKSKRLPVGQDTMQEGQRLFGSPRF